MDPKQLLIAHFEKIILAVAVGWLGYSAYGMTWKPAQLRIKEQIQGQIKSINGYVTQRQPEKAELPDWEKDIKANLLAENVPGPKQYPTWTFHRRPNIIFKFADPKPVQEAEHFPPTGAAAVAERGKITVTWEAAKDNAFVLVEKYEILRQAGAGEYSVIGDVGAEVTEYVDEAVNARSEYSYKIRSIARLNDLDPVVARMNVKQLAKDKRIRESGETERVRIPREIIVMPLIWREPSQNQILKEGRDRDLKGKVTFYVYVYVGGEGKDAWVRHKFRNVEGGLPEPALVGDPKGETRKVRGREEEVSFYTGGVLTKCGLEEREGTGGINGKRKGCYMVIRYEDGSEEKVNSFDYPEEIAEFKR